MLCWPEYDIRPRCDRARRVRESARPFSLPDQRTTPDKQRLPLSRPWSFGKSQGTAEGVERWVPKATHGSRASLRNSIPERDRCGLTHRAGRGHDSGRVSDRNSRGQQRLRCGNRRGSYGGSHEVHALEQAQDGWSRHMDIRRAPNLPGQLPLGILILAWQLPHLLLIRMSPSLSRVRSRRPLFLLVPVRTLVPHSGSSPRTAKPVRASRRTIREARRRGGHAAARPRPTMSSVWMSLSRSWIGC